MSYNINFTTKFKKDYKKFTSFPKKIKAIQDVIILLAIDGSNSIPSSMKPHTLSGNYKDNWECHILPDLLIIWIENTKEKEIFLVRLGSHSDLF